MGNCDLLIKDIYLSYWRFKLKIAKIINVPIFEDSRGSLGVVENILPFEIKRVYFIYNSVDRRGGHRHLKTRQAMICLNGSANIYLNNGVETSNVFLSSPDKCLIIEPEDWHYMDNFSEDAILLVFASEKYDITDYIEDEYL